jgi:hypothetical protein
MQYFLRDSPELETNNYNTQIVNGMSMAYSISHLGRLEAQQLIKYNTQKL